MKNYTLSLIAILLFFAVPTQAQNPSQSERMVYNLMESGILKTYKDYRSETEKYVALFKAKQSEYRTEDQIELKSAYDRAAEAFEDFIYSIRNDLLDRKKRKMIKKDCEGYVTRRLTELNQVYSEYFQAKFRPTYSMICEGASEATAYGRRIIPPEIPIALIAPITKATLDIITFIDGKNEKDLDTMKALLEKEWVEPMRFKEWEEI